MHAVFMARHDMLSFSFNSQEALAWIGLVVAADAMVHPAIVGPQQK